MFFKNIEDIGKFQLRKVILLFYYCIKLTWINFRHSPNAVYYVPAPAKRIAIYRDWLILRILKLYNSKIIFHWHAVGLGAWFKNRDDQNWVQHFENYLIYSNYRSVNLSIVLSDSLRSDAETFTPKKVVVIHNGIADPCPDFHQTVIQHRENKLAQRKAMLAGEQVDDTELRFNFIFLSQCSKEKGLFDALNGLMLLTKIIRLKHTKIKISFKVAGPFSSMGEEREFRNISEKQNEIEVTLFGFVRGEVKRLLLTEGDCLLFPTYYTSEGFPVAVIEALAFGLPVLATNWRGIPEIMGEDYDYLVPINNPQLIAEKAQQILFFQHFSKLRKRYEDNFTLDKFTMQMRKVILSLKTG